MSHRRNWIAMLVVILALVMFVPVAQAQRQDFEAIQCNAATVNVVHSSPDIRIASLEQKGIIQSTHDSKLFDNWTRHGILVIKGIDNKSIYNGFLKTLAPDGEFIIWEVSGDSQVGSTVKVLYGSGKWKGVKGEYKSKRITSGKPIVPNTEQFCEKVVGWIELAK